MYTTVVFDLDGTLLDTLQDLATAGNQTLECLGFPTHAVDAYRFMVGNGIPTLVRRMLPKDTGEATFQIALELFRTKYARHMWDTTAPYPGILPLLQSLAQNGVHMAVLSNKQDAFVKEIVDRFFPHIFSAALGQREGTPPKPAPDSLLGYLAESGAQASQILHCGDSDVDVLTAHNAGLPCCGVTWGFRGAAELKAAGADYCINTPAELLEIVYASE